MHGHGKEIEQSADESSSDSSDEEESDHEEEDAGSPVDEQMEVQSKMSQEQIE